MSEPQEFSFAFPEWLQTISALDTAAALLFLTDEGLATSDTCATLADLSLARMEVDLERAQHWLTVAEALHGQLATDAAVTAPHWLAATAQLAYAQARLAVYQGALARAEELLRQAESMWQQAHDTAGAARTFLGLTQVLAMQGRYDAAEEAAQAAIAMLGVDEAVEQGTRIPNFEHRLQLAGAHHNLATLYVYTERHSAALHTYEAARSQLNAVDQSTLGADEQVALIGELAHNELNRASALTFLDQPGAAEAALQQAIRYFEAINDLSDRGRAQTNLGRLYLRTGRYAAALAAFDRATTDLMGEAAGDATVSLDLLRRADELLLEQATGYLVMNLLPEAEQALARCEALFRSADQPYELGLTLYLWGLLRLRAIDWANAHPLLAEAATAFATLQNHFWLNRTQLAQAALTYRQGDRQSAMAILDALLADAETQIAVADQPSAAAPILLRWDLAGLCELHLLRLRIQIERNAFIAAEASATAAATQIGLDLAAVRTLLASTQPLPTEAIAAATGALPHYALRLHHLLGRLAQATGDTTMAQAHFQQALAILEQQRATLPVEEIRTAFLDDKTEIYVDLIQLLLALADDDPALMAAAFATVERARSRALLERLLTATSDAGLNAADAADDANAVASEQVDALRQRLHWLYNQLLGESGSRNLNTRLSEQLLQEEAALQRLEWRRSTLLQQAEPVDLATFQAALAPDQQAIVYTILGPKSGTAPNGLAVTSALPARNADVQTDGDRGAEVMAFLIDRKSIIAYRHLTTTATLQQALDELRFQLGRAELGSDYVARHQERLRTRLNEILGQIYQLLLAPLRLALTAKRLLIVPAGPLHRLPFHALWDGANYILSHYECSYAPSASVVVMRREKPQSVRSRRRWAGLAVDDVAIPAARAEVTGAARYFADAKLYLDAAAGRSGLERAAQTDVLHLATHGLFRPDNPFFSALKLADGWIDVREIYRLPLQAQLVILSACESGAGQIRGGDEVVGLARGFLGAGANEILASLWNVHDASAVTLMDHFYHYFIHEVQERPAAALRAAQLDAIAAQQHPYFWAPFFVIGD